MANPMKGEVAIEVDGECFTFVLGTYALAALQRRTKVPTQKFFNRKPDEWGADDMLALFHAGLMRHHKLTEEQAADLMDRCGGETLGKVLSEAIELAGMVQGGTSTARPAEAAKANGIGIGS